MCSWYDFKRTINYCLVISDTVQFMIVLGNGGCHQKCINSPGSSSCGCNVGFDLYSQNGTSGFYIEKTETGLKDGDIYRINKTCVPKMCSKLVPPLNGLLLSTKEQHHFGDKVSFQCNFGYIIAGSYGLQCTSSGTWNGTVPECQRKTFNYFELENVFNSVLSNWLLLYSLYLQRLSVYHFKMNQEKV